MLLFATIKIVRKIRAFARALLSLLFRSILQQHALHEDCALDIINSDLGSPYSSCLLFYLKLLVQARLTVIFVRTSILGCVLPGHQQAILQRKHQLRAGTHAESPF